MAQCYLFTIPGIVKCLAMTCGLITIILDSALKTDPTDAQIMYYEDSIWKEGFLFRICILGNIFTIVNIISCIVTKSSKKNYDSGNEMNLMTKKKKKPSFGSKEIDKIIYLVFAILLLIGTVLLFRSAKMLDSQIQEKCHSLYSTSNSHTYDPETKQLWSTCYTRLSDELQNMGQHDKKILKSIAGFFTGLSYGFVSLILHSQKKRK